MSWSISVKIVGASQPNNNITQERMKQYEDFTLDVSPDDCIASLHDQIEGVTGLKASQQRLIYRGRIISNNPASRTGAPKSDEVVTLRDVRGLADGHTIHLVPRLTAQPDTTAQETENQQEETERASESNNSEEGLSSGSTSLIAALLGLGVMDVDDDDDNSTETRNHRRGQRTRNATRRPRQQSYRRTEADLSVPDPGTMEPVRQGLMTMHTMIHGVNESASNPLESNRVWYVGQWLDVRDTVNQWLEATIVEVVRPDDILPDRDARSRSHGTGFRIVPGEDRAVNATDLDGRVRLLLEPCHGPGLGGDLDGLRERDTNDHVQLLLIHYNGWGHRWDEWIRSDSERIRPFRTRTRHRATSQTACPTPQGTFSGAPTTFINSDGDDESERRRLLPELRRVMTSVNEILSSSLPNEHESGLPDSRSPWLLDFGSDADPVNPEHRPQLETLAPLLDRLGRTLTDAAPHVASLASSLRAEEEKQRQSAAVRSSQESSAGQSSGYYSFLMSDDRTNPVENNDSGGLQFSFGTRPELQPNDPDFVDFVNGMINTSRDERPRSARREDATSRLLGAYLAASGLGGLASASGSANTGSDNDDEDSTGMPGLGRLVRVGGTNNPGNGIDIHIHAIVTGPGMPTVGLGGLGLEPTVIRRDNSDHGTALNSQPVVRPVGLDDNGDEDLFSDLYSENPTPLNLQDAEIEIRDDDSFSGEPVPLSATCTIMDHRNNQEQLKERTVKLQEG
eukprot:CAMPEP_0118694244 /NCGR_PEP_ID=MMETSP0800-20121206/12392_1 /TAXON_ID=210618 ORGANISM="Striatella unipunctata, Strain CCMP2910" /NCGR_SAMPLE_ID=MMETSP0800 /ASSEMBLY_ACC=CAM_ASM_000638 /LENGTH=737 /DNA_ID=CAMNT_0006592641 /DNA_START=360 /DNA_END=2574 /DNA_ORIENTATION=+